LLRHGGGAAWYGQDDEGSRVNELVSWAAPDAKLLEELKKCPQASALKVSGVVVAQNLTPAAPPPPAVPASPTPDVKKETATVKTEAPKPNEAGKTSEKPLVADTQKPFTKPVPTAIQNGVAAVGVNSPPTSVRKEEVKPPQPPAPAQPPVTPPAANRQTLEDISRLKPQDLQPRRAPQAD
jgi:hypothetical protein